MRRTLETFGIVSLVLCVGLTLAAATVAEVEPNDAAPQPLGTLSTSAEKTIAVVGTSGYAGDIDWYAFDVAGDGREPVRLVVESAASWQIVLYSDDLTHLASGANALSQDLVPGAYRVRIQQSDLGKESYVLLLTNALERESNDGLAEATGLGAIQTESVTAFGSIDPAGDVDFFSFTLPSDNDFEGAAPGKARVLRIDVLCPTEDTVLLLYAWNETLGRRAPVARNDDSSSGSWSRLYLVDPEPGTYGLRIHEYADNETIAAYRVTITPMVVEDDEPNDTAARATSLGELETSGRLSTTQFLAEGDADAYSFNVSSPLCALVETSGESDGDSEVCLVDEDGNELICNDDGGDGLWSRFFRKLEAGLYTVVVRAADGEEAFDYTLSISPAACASEAAESEPNNTVSSADPLTPAVDVAGEVSRDDADVYRVILASPATIAAETYGDADGDTTLCLLDADGETMACDDDGGEGLWSSLDYELDAGTYYLEVSLYAGTAPVNYHLLVRTDD